MFILLLEYPKQRNRPDSLWQCELHLNWIISNHKNVNFLCAKSNKKKKKCIDIKLKGQMHKKITNFCFARKTIKVLHFFICRTTFQYVSIKSDPVAGKNDDVPVDMLVILSYSLKLIFFEPIKTATSSFRKFEPSVDSIKLVTQNVNQTKVCYLLCDLPFSNLLL